MSRIDTRNEPFINQRPAANNARVEGKDSSNVPAGAFGVKNIRSRIGESFRIRSKKTRRLSSATDISEASLQPLAGKKREEFIGDLTRLLNCMIEIERNLGEDETSSLCKVMLKEQIRRMLLVDGAQSDADVLRGNA